MGDGLPFLSWQLLFGYSYNNFNNTFRNIYIFFTFFNHMLVLFFISFMIVKGIVALKKFPYHHCQLPWTQNLKDLNQKKNVGVKQFIICSSLYCTYFILINAFLVKFISNYFNLFFLFHLNPIEIIFLGSKILSFWSLKFLLQFDF